MYFSIRTLLILTALIAFAILASKHCLGPVVPLSVAKRVRPGITRSEVIAILGLPNDGMTNQSWEYVRIFNPGWFVVHFDANGEVAYVDHETVF